MCDRPQEADLTSATTSNKKATKANHIIIDKS